MVGGHGKEATWLNKLNVLLTLSLGSSVWSASRSGCFIPWEIPLVSIHKEAGCEPHSSQ